MFMKHLKAFIKATVLEWAVLSAVAGVMAAVWSQPPSYEKFIAISAPGDPLYRPDLAYPHIPPVFSAALAGVLAALIPLSVFLGAQIWLRSFTDFASAILGLGYSLVTSTLIQVILKKTIGGFRPHFLSVYQPDLSLRNGTSGQGYKQVIYKVRDVCTGKDHWAIANALESFPSGHAVIAFAAFGYLAIYLFAHLRISSRGGDLPGLRKEGTFFLVYWRMLIVLAPVVFATYLSSTLVSGYHHHAHDVVFGALIGMVTAVFGYRMVFRGVVDAEWNIVPYLHLKVGDEGDSESV